ncbi:ASCH domain-containing protein [Cronobacter muytjensii]|nr:ASCH domain-containing protein [Cronobacter muytjensii]
MTTQHDLQQRYPGARAWSFGDSPHMADELGALVASGAKRATCSDYHAWRQDAEPTLPGDYHIILNGAGEPLCVIRTHTLRMVAFCDVTDTLAALEGEGDLSLAYWRHEHEAFFTRAGCFAKDMLLMFEEFALVERC